VSELADEHRHDSGGRSSAAHVQAITLQFHPDWPHRDAKVIESMCVEGHYRSQFATGISNGGLTAFPGGDRWRWESRLFAGRYDEGPGPARPVYGAWNRRGDPYGGAIRFGSSYVRLRAEAVSRSTFCFPDSVLEPVDVGDAALLPRLCRMADESGFDDLDDCVEAHVHGAVRFDTAVKALVLDPCFAGTDVEAAAERLGCPIEFHPGFRASPECFDPEYRGPHIVDLARSRTSSHRESSATPPGLACTRRSRSSRSGTAWHALDEWTSSAPIGALDLRCREPCVEGADEPAVASHHCGWIARDTQNVVAGDEKPFTRERLEDFLVQERIAGADDGELPGGVRQQHVSDRRLGEEWCEPCGFVAAGRGT